MTNVNKHSKLEKLNNFHGFFLGQLEGQYIRNMSKMINQSDRADELINALNHFEFTKKIYENYSVIETHKNDAVFIANYLCSINWMSGLYCRISEPDEYWKDVLKNFGLSSETEYFKKAADYYCFAYDFLNRKFYNDSKIKDAVKTNVYRLND